MPKAAKTYHPLGQSPSERRKRYEATPERKEAQKFYSTAKWRRLKKWYKAHHPLCADCLDAGREVWATDVHHIVKRSEDPSREMDVDNLMGLCDSCHGKRTARGE